MFVLGTDAVGRDILSRLIYGSRYSLFIGFVVVAFSLVSGVILGLLAGYFRGWVDTLIMRIMDIILAFPSLLLALVLVAILGPGLFNAMLAIALVLQPHFARLTRAAVMAEKNREYVVSAKVAGAGHLRLMLVTILPNCVAPLIVQATLSFSNAILEAAALGFLGQGAQPPTPEWGTMLANAREFVTVRTMDRDVSGPRHPDHRACHQPGRRRPARRTRSEAEAKLRMDAALVGLLGILLGVIATAVMTRMIEVRRRFDREIELIIALHAEMVAGLRRANEQTTREEIDYVEHDDDPFGVADRNGFRV